MIYYSEYASPLGTLLLAARDQGLCGIYFEGHRHFKGTDGWQHDPGRACLTGHCASVAPNHANACTTPGLPLSASPPKGERRVGVRCAICTITQTQQQLSEFFSGSRTTFDLPLDLDGTPFQKTVWQALLTIPFGSTVSYAQHAQRVGKPTAVRAVGAAIGRNPLSIVVPCHRVVGYDGALTGYAGGLERKQALLDIETRHCDSVR
jgi:methylated-DNA-[protein]-cysteine S-methyltransferase